MNQPITVETERVDDIPVLLTHMQRMGLPALVNKHFPTHGNRNGLDVGHLVAVWLAYILSRGDHRLSHVQAWVEKRLHTLNHTMEADFTPLDWTDDRLAAVLRLLSEDRQWQAFEQALCGRLLRVYALEAKTVRIDTTSASGYWSISEGGLFQFGHSKDYRPDLPQVKVALATLDPLGLPVATDVIEGHRADDPLYVPAARGRVRKTLDRQGLLYVGDCKMAALDTRAFIARGGDHYLCPLAKAQCPEAQRAAYLASEAAQAPVAISDREGRRVAEAFEVSETLTAQTPDGEPFTWLERRLVVRSRGQAEAAEKALQRRLAKAEAQLARLNERGRGKRRYDERSAFEARVEAIVGRHKVGGLLQVEIEEQINTRTVRAYGDQPMRIEWRRRFSVSVVRDAQALAVHRARLGWRVYATNHDGLTLSQAVWAYRSQYVLERSFGRLKGRPLSLSPMYLQRDDHATGLIRLLSLGLRVLILLEFVVRRQLALEQATLSGVYAGNPKRATARPTAELLLEAFQDITLTVVVFPGGRHYHLTPLTAPQVRILALLGLAVEIYTGLCRESVKPP